MITITTQTNYGYNIITAVASVSESVSETVIVVESVVLIVMMKYRGCHGQGKSKEKQFFQGQGKSVNFVFRVREILEFCSKSGNILNILRFSLHLLNV